MRALAVAIKSSRDAAGGGATAGAPDYTYFDDDEYPDHSRGEIDEDDADEVTTTEGLTMTRKNSAVGADMPAAVRKVVKRFAVVPFASNGLVAALAAREARTAQFTALEQVRLSKKHDYKSLLGQYVYLSLYFYF